MNFVPLETAQLLCFFVSKLVTTLVQHILGYRLRQTQFRGLKLFIVIDLQAQNINFWVRVTFSVKCFKKNLDTHATVLFTRVFCGNKRVKVKVSQSRYRSGQAQRVPEVKFPRFRNNGTGQWQVVSLTHRLPLSPGNTPGTHFCWRLSRPQDQGVIGRIM